MRFKPALTRVRAKSVTRACGRHCLGSDMCMCMLVSLPEPRVPVTDMLMLVFSDASAKSEVRTAWQAPCHVRVGRWRE